jgi:hypothetical protein
VALLPIWYQRGTDEGAVIIKAKELWKATKLRS